jgi:hypothetical protein
MHYKNGREAKNGDKVLTLAPCGFPVVGILYDARAEAGSDCNGNIMAPGSAYTQCADLKNCIHFEDVLAAAVAGTIPNSTPPPPSA